MIYISYRLTLMPLAQAVAWLNKSELDYLSTVSMKRALQFANGRALLRRMLEQKMAINSAQINIDLPSEQAPKITVAGQIWQLSISHSGTAIAVACSEQHQVGIDIERMKLRQFAKLSSDYAALANATESLSFYRHWTAAEAYSKLFSLPLLQVLQQPLVKELQCKHLLLSDYMLCLCSKENTVKYILYEDKL